MNPYVFNILKSNPPSLESSSIFTDILPYNDTGGYNGYTVRIVIPASEMSPPEGSVEKIKLSLAGPATGTTSISGMYIGHSAGTSGNYSFSATPNQVTVSSAAAFVLPTNTTVESDVIDFTWDGVSDIVVSFYINASGNLQRRLSGNSGYLFVKFANDPATVSASGYSPSGNNPNTSSLITEIVAYY